MNRPWEPPKTAPGCTPACPSDLEMDTLVLEELKDAEAEALQKRIDTCAGCESRLSARSAGFSAFPDVDVESMISKIHVGTAEQRPEPSDTDRENSWLTWLFGAKWLGAAALATIAVVLVLPELDAPPSDDVIRPKSAGQDLTVFIERDGRVDVLEEGGQATEGNRIRFKATNMTGGFLTILGQEASGDVYILDELTLQSDVNQTQLELPGAYELDDSLGAEALIVYHCIDKVPSETLKRLAAVDGCTKHLRSFTKVARE